MALDNLRKYLSAKSRREIELISALIDIADCSRDGFADEAEQIRWMIERAHIGLQRLQRPLPRFTRTPAED